MTTVKIESRPAFREVVLRGRGDDGMRVAVVRSMAADGKSYRKLASESGVPHMTVWRWLTQGDSIGVAAATAVLSACGLALDVVKAAPAEGGAA